MFKPILEPEFKPAIVEFRQFVKDVATCENKQHLIVAVERNDGFIC